MKDDRRAARAAEIEKAAYLILDAKGYEGLSMQAVARAAKASNETLYRWYGDKIGLFRALILRNTETVGAALARHEGADPLDTLAQVGPVLLTMLLGDRAVALNRAAAADATGQLGQALAEAGRGTVAPWIEAVMTRAMAQGQLGPGDPATMAALYFDLLIGDSQIRRVIGTLPAPDAAMIDHRAARALDHLTRLHPAQP